MGLRKKIAVSGKYKGTEREDGAVYYESVLWTEMQNLIITPESVVYADSGDLLCIVNDPKFSLFLIQHDFFHNSPDSFSFGFIIHIRT